jgi:hypothetical protein
MVHDLNEARLAEILAADRDRRAEVEAEIARKEGVLLREMAKLARLNAENDALDDELVQARREAEDALELDARPSAPDGER